MAGNSYFKIEIGLTNSVSGLIRRCASISVGSLLFFAIVLLQPSAVVSQVHETFDSPEVSWFAVKAMSHCKVEPGSVKHERVKDSETGLSCEQFIFNAASGSDLMVAYEVTPAMVIPELKGAVRIKSARRGIQLCARAVLPHCSAPGSVEPLTVILKGPIGRQRERWETLKFDGKFSFKKLLESEKWILRGRYGDSITLRDAYIDRLMLDIYTGPGESNIQIEDLKFTGIVEATNVAKLDSEASIENVALIADHLNEDYANETIRVVAAQQDVKQKSTHVVRDGTVILVDERPFFPIIIEHNGESFEFLKAIGFNTVELRGSPTAKQLAEARESDMWLIAPPPPSVGISQLGREYDPVLAWSVGKDLTDRDISSVRQRVREIRESDTREGRPIFGHAKSHWKRIAQMVDIQALGQQPIGTSYIASRYSDWIEQRAREVGSSKPVCADIQTEMNPAVIEQAKAIFGAGTKTPTPIEFQQLKTLVVEAITAGSRCLRFRSDSRLDAGDPVTRLRSSTVQYVNRWLEQVEPWVSGGAVMGVLPTDARLGNGRHGDSIRVTAINTNRGRLLLVQRPTHHEQFWAGDVPQKSITIVDSDTIHTNRVYHLTDAELKPVSTQRTPQGTAITIDDAPYMSTIVMTQDAALVNQLTGVLTKSGRQSMFDLHLSITQQWRVIQQLLDGQIGRLGKGTPASSGAMNEAISAIQNVQRLSQQKSYAQAMPFLDRADERLAFFRRELQATALGTFQSKTSSPLVFHAGLIPLHWLLAGQIPRSEAGINHLPGGDFENKSLTVRSGWGNTRVEDSRLMTDVAFETRAARDGKYGLKLKVEGRGISIVDTPPLRVTSPPVRVKPRQLVRIHGWVNVPNVILGSDDGFRIVESLGGESLAETIPVTQGWQEFTLYRTAVEDTQLRIELQLTGLGEAMVDEVTVQVIDLPAPARSARK